jgi:signal transduction histidine kinase
MRLTPRRRAVIAVLISWPVGYYYLDFAVYTGINIFRDYRSGYVGCDGTWRSYFNSCNPSGYSATAAWLELIFSTAIVVTLAWFVARWVVRPVAEIADTVGRFGPNSLGLRLRASGPSDETRRLADEIDAMLDRLAEGYEAQRRFASNASHELRTPLATQRALIEVSLTSALTDEQLELLSRQLLATNERNERLVDGLLTLAETERGLATNGPVRLDRVTADVIETLRPTAKQRELEVSAVLAPTSVYGEEPLLDRLVTNLVSNAIKYNEPGGSVIVNLTPDAVLTVANTGPVVPPEQVPALFEPFRRLAGERLDHGGGVGLGLTIARSIVAAHSGAIDARANPGGGLVVAVRLHPIR